MITGTKKVMKVREAGCVKGRRSAGDSEMLERTSPSNRDSNNSVDA
jgi:hypothetical protein